jgi:serine protease inhibitor
MIRLTRALTLAAAASLAACAESPSASKPLEALPRPLTATEQAVISGSNTFAWGLLREAGRGQTGKNVFVSPLSVSMALGMTSNGARGNTATEIHQALGFGAMSQAEINAAYRGLKDLLLGLDSNVDMRVANSVWYRQGFPFDAPFFQVLDQSFDAQATPLNFGDPAAPGQINAWVSEETSGRIPTIVETIDQDQVMFLVNAVYFKGGWTNRFDRGRTRDAHFRRADGSTVSVRMMGQSDMPVRFASTDQWAAADLPYGNGAFVMTVVVPERNVTLDRVMEGLDSSAEWAALTSLLHDTEVVVELPRFKVEWKDDLRPALQALGIQQAFRDGFADFSGMSATSGTSLFVSEVLHKTFVEVNEEGTEAAAATSVGMGVTSLPPGIYADRPFLVAIRERFSGTILFLGRIEDPS